MPGGGQELEFLATHFDGDDHDGKVTQTEGALQRTRSNRSDLRCELRNAGAGPWDSCCRVVRLVFRRNSHHALAKLKR